MHTCIYSFLSGKPNVCVCMYAVNFMGNSQKTKPEYKTLNPCYYQTFIFDEVAIPAADNFLYSPQVSYDN